MQMKGKMKDFFFSPEEIPLCLSLHIRLEKQGYRFPKLNAIPYPASNTFIQIKF